MPNEAIRFRAEPAVHAAKATLHARGVDVGGLLCRTLVDAATEEDAIVREAQRLGLTWRRVWPHDQNVEVILVTRDDAEGRRVYAFVKTHHGRVSASVTKIVAGDEMLNLAGRTIPADLPASEWFAFADAQC